MVTYHQGEVVQLIASASAPGALLTNRFLKKQKQFQASSSEYRNASDLSFKSCIIKRLQFGIPRVNRIQ